MGALTQLSYGARSVDKDFRLAGARCYPWASFRLGPDRWVPGRRCVAARSLRDPGTTDAQPSCHGSAVAA